MQKYKYTQNNFTSGEIDPKSTGLVGTSFFASAIKECRGFLPMPSGGIMRTPGTYYLSEAYKSGVSRLEELITIDETYIFEFYENYIHARNIKNDSIIQGIDTTYKENELRELSIIANSGSLYVAHKDHPLAFFKVENNAITKTIPTFTTKGLDFSTEDNYPSIVSFRGGRMILASTNNNPNKIWQSRTPTVETDDAEIPVLVNRFFDFTLYDYSTLIIVTIKSDPLTNQDSYEKEVSINYTTYSTGALSDYTKVSIYKHRTAMDTYPIVLTKTTITEKGTASVNITSRKIVEEKTTTKSDQNTEFVYSEPTHFEPVESNYPNQVTTYEDPVITKILDNSHAIETQETDMYGSRIRWISSMGRLSVATSRAIFIDNGEIATPSTFDISVSIYQSIGQKKSKSIKNYIIFTGNDEKSLYLGYYNYDSESLNTIEISKNARSLISSGIVDFTLMFDPFPIIWIVTKDGNLASCLINFSSDGIIPSWALQTKDETRKYVAVCSSGDYNNILYLNIKNTNETIVNHTIEKMIINEETDVNNSFFFDKGVVKTYSSETKEIVGLPYKDGTVLEVIADNYLLEKKVCYNNSITTERSAKEFKIGMVRKSYLVMFDPILSSDGNCIITKHSILKVFLRLYESGVAKLGSEGNKAVPIIYRRFGSAKMDNDIELYTEDVAVSSPSTNTYSGNLKIVVDEPFPFNLLAISYIYKITEE